MKPTSLIILLTITALLLTAMQLYAPCCAWCGSDQGRVPARCVEECKR